MPFAIFSAPMNEANYLQALRRVPYFSEAKPETLGALARSVRRLSVASGDRVFHQGESAHGFFLVLDGSLTVTRMNTDGDETVLHVMRAGDFIGEVPLHAQGEYPATAEASEASRLLYVPRDALFAAIRQDPSIGLRLLAALAQRLLVLVSRFEDLTRRPVRARLARALLEAAAREGVETREGLQLKLPLTQGQLADVVGTTRETVSRTLHGWQRLGWLRMRGRVLSILDRTALEALIGEA